MIPDKIKVVQRIVSGIAILGFILVIVVIFSFHYMPVPLLDFLAPEWNREFGFVESLQNILLIGISVLFFIKASPSENKRMRRINKLLGIAFLGLFLEEIDYFLHYVEYFFGLEPFEISLNGVRNFHNIGLQNFQWINVIAIILRSAGTWILILTTFIVSIITCFKSKNSTLYGLNIARPAGIVSSIMFLLLLISMLLKTLPHEDYRQIKSEICELLIYSCLAFMIGWPDKNNRNLTAVNQSKTLE